MRTVVLVGARTATRLEKPAPGDFPAGYAEDLLCYWPCGRGSWDLNLPDVGLACLAGHQTTVHEDGTVTAAPSILTTGYDKGDERVAHGYLERGAWRDA
jgi:hypothetical protein